MNKNNGVNTVILHVGRHKTGTSSIQATLSAHRDKLARQGILYPKSLHQNHSNFFVNAFSPAPEKHPANARENRTRERLHRAARQKSEQIQAEIEGFEKIIFSAEDACALPPQGIANIKTLFDKLIAPKRYQIILYTRAPVSRAMSAIQQNVKGNRLTLEDAKARHVRGSFKQFSAIIEDYSRVFGADTLMVRPFEAALKAPGGLTGDFCATLGIDPTGIDPIRQNEGISAEIVYFLSWLYEGPRLSEGPGPVQVNRKSRVPITAEDQTLLFSLKGAKADFLTPEEIDHLWTTVAEDMAFLETTYGIIYRKPQPDQASNDQLFAPDFMERIEAMLPSLSPPIRDEMRRFLETLKH